MLKQIHEKILRRAVGETFSARALEAITAANLHQDILPAQIGHDEYHFDNNALERSRSYIEEQRSLITPAIERGQGLTAWQAFGRLTHSAQDFYSHSNYVDLWLACQPTGMEPAPSEIDPVDDALIENPALRSGKFYYPLEAFSFVPGLRRLVKPLLPRDSHAWMNLDSARSGPLFEFAFQAAIKRTKYEFDATTKSMTKSMKTVFTDKP